MSSIAPKLGDFNATIDSINISLSAERPAIFTRLCITDDKSMVTHAIRLDNPDSQRIGFDEMRSAFPAILGTLDDEQLLVTLMSKTDEFKNAPVRVGIEPQLDRKTGVQAKSPTGQPYFNVRLRSGVRNLDTNTASNLAKRLLAGVHKAAVIEGAFDS